MMQTFSDRLNRHFGNTLAEDKELYTKENLKVINQIKEYWYFYIWIFLKYFCKNKSINVPKISGQLSLIGKYQK